MHKNWELELTERIRLASIGSPLLKGTGLAIPRSRVQRIHRKNAWLKRDDELSFSISGPKFRKLCGLSDIISSAERIISYGSARSQFLFGLAQLCLAEQKPLELYLLRSQPWQEEGTDRLYRSVLEAPALNSLQWVDREDWAGLPTRLRAAEGLVIPEGGVMDEALWGALSLPLDIIEQFERLGEPLPRQVWIDAGTGLTAKAMILGLGTLLADPPHVHVVLCAGSEDEFRLNLQHPEFRAAPYSLHRPPTARSYGAANQAVWSTIDRFLQTEGVLLDPIYTAKLMMAFEAEGEEGSLLVHSGGGLNNFGFERFLGKENGPI